MSKNRPTTRERILAATAKAQGKTVDQVQSELSFAPKHPDDAPINVSAEEACKFLQELAQEALELEAMVQGISDPQKQEEKLGRLLKVFYEKCDRVDALDAEIKDRAFRMEAYGSEQPKDSPRHRAR